MYRRMAGLIIGVAGLLIFSWSKGHADTLLRLATVDNFPPYSYMENGNLTGVAIDVVNETAKRLGIRVSIKAYPWRRVFESVKEGYVDGGFSVFKNRERLKIFLYTGIIHHEEYHLFVLKNNRFPFSGIEDLYGKTIGIDRGVFVSEAFGWAVKQKRIFLDEVNDMAMLNVGKLCKNRIDALIGDKNVIPVYASLAGRAHDLLSLGPVHERQNAYLVLSKKSPLPNKALLQRQITDILQEIRNDGTYQRIFDRYKNPAKGSVEHNER